MARILHRGEQKRVSRRRPGSSSPPHSPHNRAPSSSTPVIIPASSRLERARELVAGHWQTIEAVAGALELAPGGLLDGDELRRIVGGER